MKRKLVLLSVLIGVTLFLSACGPSIVVVIGHTADGTQFSLQPGQELTFKAEEKPVLGDVASGYTATCFYLGNNNEFIKCTAEILPDPTKTPQ